MCVGVPGSSAAGNKQQVLVPPFVFSFMWIKVLAVAKPSPGQDTNSKDISRVQVREKYRY